MFWNSKFCKVLYLETTHFLSKIPWKWQFIYTNYWKCIVCAELACRWLPVQGNLVWLRER